MFSRISGTLQCNAAVRSLLQHFQFHHRYSAAATTAGSNSFLEEYLRTSLGFSKEEAASTILKVAPRQKPIPMNPDSVVTFFQDSGFDKFQIKFFISAQPELLLCDIEKTLKPKIEFWRNVLGSDENVVLALKRWRFLMLNYAQKKFTSLIPALREVGFSDQAIPRLVVANARALFVLTPERAVEVGHRVENELGIPRKSAMFFHGFLVLCSAKESTIDLKKAVFRSFGWSDSEMAMLFMKFPMIMRQSEARLRKGLGFFMGELGYSANFLASHHTLLVVGVETRVKPRNEVLKMLDSKKLKKTTVGFYSAMCLPEKQFVERFLVPFKDQIPDAYESYVKTMQKVKRIHR